MIYLPILITILTLSEIVVSEPLQKRAIEKDGSLGKAAKTEIQDMIDQSLKLFREEMMETIQSAVVISNKGLQTMIDNSIAKNNKKQQLVMDGTVTVNVSPNNNCPKEPPALTGIPTSTTVFDLDNAVGMALSQANSNGYCREVNQKISIGKNMDLSIFDHRRLSALTFPVKAGDTVAAKYSTAAKAQCSCSEKM